MSLSQSDYIRTRAIELEARTFALEFAMSSRIRTERVAIAESAWIDEERVRFTTQLLCRRATHVVHMPAFSVPDGWWQSFKSEHFPRWLLKRYPVRMKTLGGGTREIDMMAMFPEIEPVRSKQRICYWSQER